MAKDNKIKSVQAVTAAAAPTTDETAKAIERLRGERDAYKKAKEVEALEAEGRASLTLQESFDAGFQWAHSASYETLKDVAEWGASWVRDQSISHVLNRTVAAVYGAHNAKEFQAGAKAFFEKLPKD